MTKKKTKSRIRLLVEFLKLQLAGNVLFWVTYVSYWLFDYGARIPYPVSFVMANIAGNIVFFLVDRHWIYNAHTGKRKNMREVVRFVIFMTVNFFLNILIIHGLQQYLHISPYIGQFIAGVFFGVWTFLGLHFWVFQPDHTRHPGLTYTRRKHHGRKSPKQKAA